MKSIDEAAIEASLKKVAATKQEIARMIVGQERVVTELLIGLLAGGHCILEGVPGLGKTLMIRTLAQATHLSFRRIQFTPDLMPSDMIGTEILEEDHASGKRFFKFQKGPIFANLILADEINRTPPKTQAALLEAMQERTVSYGGQTYPLEPPFFVLATQNPVEQAGTYPLPEAQLDRFLLFIKVSYPTEGEELQILESTTGSALEEPQQVLSGSDLIELQQLTRQIVVAPELFAAANRLVRAGRPQISSVPQVKQYVRWGPGPRAGQALILTAKAAALLQNRLAVTPEDLRWVAPSVLRHRILLNFQAEADQVDTDHIIQTLQNTVL